MRRRSDVPHDRDRFLPRPIGPEREAVLRAHQEKYEGVMTYLPPNWREEIKLDFSQCPHTTSTFIEIEGPHGIWGVFVCDNCGVQHARECAHVRCDWMFDGKLLVCANCGVDGT